ncbi:MAG: hypothetical protein J6R04_03650, partial [Clostridia bacterium]|nr:hypothetical protein [Clostridia bacterium]
MKVLILTCHTGEGHNSTAAAVRDVFDANGTPCESADTLAFLSPLVSRVVRRAHERIYRHIPKAFSTFYRAAEQKPEAFERRSLLYFLLTKGAKKLHRFVTEGGYDTIVCTHAFSSVLATGLLEQYPDCKVYTAFVATDYTCSPSVKESRLNVYFIPDEAIREAVSLSVRYIPDRFLPDKAIDLIDEAAAKVRIRHVATSEEDEQTKDERQRLTGEKETAIANGDLEQAALLRDRIATLPPITGQKESKDTALEVRREDVAQVVTGWTGIPVHSL